MAVQTVLLFLWIWDSNECAELRFRGSVCREGAALTGCRAVVKAHLPGTVWPHQVWDRPDRGECSVH